VFGFIITFLSVLFHYLFISAFLNEKRKIALWKVALLLFIITITRYSLYLLRHTFDDSLGISLSIVSAIVAAIFIAKVCFKPTMKLALASAMLTLLLFILAEYMATFIITRFHNISIHAILQPGIYSIQFNILIGIIMTVNLVIVKCIRVELDNSIRKSILIALLLAALLYMIIFLPLLGTQSSSDAITAIEVIAILSAIIAVICIFVLTLLIAKHSKKTRIMALIEIQNTAQRTHIEHLLKTHAEIKKMSHDFKHHVNMLYVLGKAHKYDELLETLAKLGSVYDDALIVDTSNTMFDAILSTKLDEAQKHGIDCKLHLDVKANAAYLSLEVCTLLSNGLDNAIEACLRAGDAEKLIEFEAISTPVRFMCRMRNTLGVPPQVDGDVFQTKKKDKRLHGIGLKSMKQTCAELGGDMVYEFDEAFFMVHISLPV